MRLSTHRLSETGRFGSLTAALTVVLSLFALSEVRAACKIEQISEFHVERLAGPPIIEGQVNGQPIRILLETGSVISYLTLAAAHQLKLPVHKYVTATLNGADGYESIETANVKELRIGQLLLKDQSLNVVAGEIHDGNGVASLQLGVDFFYRFTSEFDLANGVVRVLRPTDCKLEQLAYWSPAFYKVELQRFSPDNNAQFIVNIKVNGKAGAAKLVSGSAISYITLDGAKDAGIEPRSAGVEPEEPYRGGSMKSPAPTWTARIDTLELGGETIKNAHLHVGGRFIWGTPTAFTEDRVPYEIQLGSDFFRAHRVLIAPDQQAVLFTYNGGRVF